MTRIPFLTFVVLLALSPSARAIHLVVMATNTTAIAGEKVFTIGVKVTAADVAAGGPNAVLVVQNVTFTGGANGPLQQTGAANKPDVQSVQTSVLDVSAENNGGPPSPPLSTSGTNAFYRDSWWYTSAAGTLQGVIDSAGDSGVVTTAPASDGSGVYTLGLPSIGNSGSGTGAVGITGYTFQAAGSPGAVPANPTSGQTISVSGLFGPIGADYWDPAPGDPNHILGNLLVANGGTLTVPLLQLVAKGDINVPSFPGGAGTFLELGTPIYNVLGGPQNVDPGDFLDYADNSISGICPEPGTFVLAAMAAIVSGLRYRRRGISFARRQGIVN